MRVVKMLLGALMAVTGFVVWCGYVVPALVWVFCLGVFVALPFWFFAQMLEAIESFHDS